jgi:arylsulfatase A-like enzyme
MASGELLQWQWFERARGDPRLNIRGGVALQSEIRVPKSEMTRRAVVVSFDHVHAGFLGCCGNDWIETPNLDRLAAKTVLFDQHFCDNLDAAAPDHAWWTGRHQFPLADDQPRESPAFVENLHSRGVHTTLIVESDGRHEAAIAPPFGEVITVRGSDGFDVAENETPFARVVRRGCDWLRDAADKAGPALLWIKSRGIPTPWVPPQAFAELYLDDFGLAEEGLPQHDSEEDLKTAESPAAAEEEPPTGGRDGSLDWRYAAAMYAAYVTLVDRWLGILLQTLKETPGWNDALLIVTAASGQSLGEHGSLADESLPLRSEAVQTPLWVRDPGSDQGGTRRQDLVQSIDLAPTLSDWFCAPEAAPNPVQPPAPPQLGRSLLPLIRNEPITARESLVLGNSRLEWGIRTPEFFYVEPGDRHPDPAASPSRLFEKPSDRWDQSDVLSQYPQITEELQAALHRQIEELTAHSAAFSRSRQK